ncbi:nuclear transport factor 2 family protein [Azospirillum halopraeferens]|uniref:nuclear transport factor 2 family protein n=1 Tax=Azospirillum halopraeferens TaxID=34010 RepID=UPI00040B639E|nr:nuclear transport factor 2 family protein [Azospirillum halopraeferens]
MLQLPTPIEAYFEAERRSDADILVTALANDAVVRDEGATHSGIDAIRRWWLSARDAYGYTAEPMGMTANNGGILVSTKVSGRFPGSPATLTFIFYLKENKISGLEIR